MFRRSRRLFLFACVAAMVGAPAAAGQRPAARETAAHSSLVVIVNTQNPVNELSVGDLRRILLGETTRWPDGRRITVAMRESDQAERDAMLRIVCNMNDQDFTRYLLHATFRGALQTSPKVLETATGVKRFVFNVPGAIGYVRSDEVDASVKTVKITGVVYSGPAFGLTLTTR